MTPELGLLEFLKEHYCKNKLLDVLVSSFLLIALFLFYIFGPVKPGWTDQCTATLIKKITSLGKITLVK